MKASITLEVQASRQFTEDDIIDIIGIDLYNEKKDKTPGGLFKAFVLMHEGASNVKTLSSGGIKKIWWGRKAIQAALDKVKKGIKFFNKHNKDNSTKDRDEFGEIVGKVQREIDGKDSVVVVGYFPPDKRQAVEKSDGVSMEAVWNILEKGNQYIADGIEKITGISLCSTADGEKPGFSGAQQLATVQAYNEVNMSELNATQPKQSIDFDDIDFKEFKRIARKLRIFPSQIWDMEDIIGKRVVSENGAVSYIGGDRDVQEYVEKQLFGIGEKEIKKLQTDLEQTRKDNSVLKQKLDIYNAQPRIEELAKELKLPAHVINLAKANINSLKIGEKPDDSYKEFLQEQIKESEKLVSMGFSPQDETPAEPDRPVLGQPQRPDKNKNPFLPEEER
jgi:hypothetical protein